VRQAQPISRCALAQDKTQLAGLPLRALSAAFLGRPSVQVRLHQRSSFEFRSNEQFTASC